MSHCAGGGDTCTAITQTTIARPTVASQATTLRKRSHTNHNHSYHARPSDDDTDDDDDDDVYAQYRTAQLN